MRRALSTLLVVLALAGAAAAQTPPGEAQPPPPTAAATDSTPAADGWEARLRRTLESWGMGDLEDFLGERDWGPILLVVFNGLLVFFAYRLWRAHSGLAAAVREQSHDLKQSIAGAREAADIARIAADAAALQAKVLVGVERPRLELSSVQLAWSDQSVRQALKTPTIDVGFTNHGRTAAFVTSKCIEVRMAPSLPDDPAYGAVETLQIVEVVDSGKTVSASAQRRLGDLTEDQIRLVLGGRNSLWVYGFVAFRDFLGLEHKLGYCLRWAPPEREASIGGAFIAEGPARYIYQTDQWPK